MATEEEEEAFLETLLDEALEGFERVVTKEEVRAIRACLRDEHLFHPAGRARLKQAMAAPVVDESHIARKDGKDSSAAPSKKQGEGG